VQKLLGHESPEMTMRYAYIHDETLRKELDKFHKNRVIDITGQIVSLELEGNPQDLEWFTKEICAIALPNGYCGRPKVLGDCDIAGDVGCYLCPHFRTNKTFLSVHKDQLESIDKVLAKAYKYNWQLPIKKNEPIKQNLKLIISTLEADNEQAQ
jgi:integrase/recombinase XerD